MSLILFLRPVLFALFLWWFTTGLIIVVYGRSPLLVRLYFGGATVALLAALVGLVAIRTQVTSTAVYLAFTCGVVIWGWQTASYYLGYITGPKQPEATAVPATQYGRFLLAAKASIYHELLAALTALLLVGLTWGQPNRWGLWVYLAMWLMHLSAKLNVFFGVRNFRIDFLPPHLHHLDALLNKRSSNPLLPVSVLLATSVALLLLYRAIMPTAVPTQTVGSLLVATMLALGMLEHLLLVLPVPVAIWGWGVRPLADDTADERRVASSEPLTVRVMSDQII